MIMLKIISISVLLLMIVINSIALNNYYFKAFDYDMIFYFTVMYSLAGFAVLDSIFIQKYARINKETAGKMNIIYKSLSHSSLITRLIAAVFILSLVIAYGIAATNYLHLNQRNITLIKNNCLVGWMFILPYFHVTTRSTIMKVYRVKIDFSLGMEFIVKNILKGMVFTLLFFAGIIFMFVLKYLLFG